MRRCGSVTTWPICVTSCCEPSDCMAIHVFVFSRGKVVKLWKGHHGGDQSYFHLCSVNSRMLQCYMVNNVLPVGNWTSSNLIAGLCDWPLQPDVGLRFFQKLSPFQNFPHRALHFFRHPLWIPPPQPKCTTPNQMNGRTGVLASMPDLV